MGQILDCFCKGIHINIEFTQSHRPEEAIPYSNNKCQPGFISFVQSWFSANPGFKFNPPSVSFRTFGNFKTSEIKTTIYPGKISEEIFPSF